MLRLPSTFYNFVPCLASHFVCARRRHRRRRRTNSKKKLQRHNQKIKSKKYMQQQQILLRRHPYGRAFRLFMDVSHGSRSHPYMCVCVCEPVCICVRMTHAAAAAAVACLRYVCGNTTRQMCETRCGVLLFGVRPAAPNQLQLGFRVIKKSDYSWEYRISVSEKATPCMVHIMNTESQIKIGWHLIIMIMIIIWYCIYMTLRVERNACDSKYSVILSMSIIQKKSVW